MKTTVVNLNEEKYDVYIGRGSKWGNPYPITNERTRKQAIEMYEEYLVENEELLNDVEELKGKILGCFCKPKACHGDILAKIANNPLSEFLC